MTDVLGPAASDGGDVVSALLAKINDAPSGHELKKMGRLLRLLDDMEALPAPAFRKLYSRYNSTMVRVYDAYVYDAYAQDKTDLEIPEDPVWRLRRAVGSNKPFLVVLDGHNVLYALPDLFGLHPDSDSERQTEGRNLLTASVAGLFGAADQCEAMVYFDGPERSDTMVCQNVKVIYSGGTGRDRADKAIIEYLEFLHKSEPEKPVIVVTDDRDLRRQAEQLEAKPISTHQLGALLDEIL